MSRDEPLTPMEQRLRREADGLLRSYGDLPPPEELIGKHRRRVKQRVRIVGGCAVAATLGIAMVFSQTQWRLPDNGQSHPQGPIVVKKDVTDANTSPVVAMQEPDGDPAYPEELVNAVPIFLVQWGADGKPVVTAAFYVAEPEVTLRLDDLTPGERYAVQQVLGPGGPDLSSQTL